MMRLSYWIGLAALVAAVHGPATDELPPLPPLYCPESLAFGGIDLKPDALPADVAVWSTGLESPVTAIAPGKFGAQGGVFVGLRNGHRGLLTAARFQAFQHPAPAPIVSMLHSRDLAAVAFTDANGLVSIGCSAPPLLEPLHAFWRLQRKSAQQHVLEACERTTPAETPDTTASDLQFSRGLQWIGMLSRVPLLDRIQLFRTRVEDGGFATRAISIPNGERALTMSFCQEDAVPSLEGIPSLLAVGTVEGTVRVFDVDTGKPIPDFKTFTPARDRDVVRSVVFAKKRLFATDLNGRVHTWDFSLKKPGDVRTLKAAAHYDAIRTQSGAAVKKIVPGASGDQVVLVSGLRDPLELWKKSNNGEVWEFVRYLGAAIDPEHPILPSQVIFLERDHLLWLVSENSQRRVVVFDTSTGRVVRAYNWLPSNFAAGFYVSEFQTKAWLGTEDGHVIQFRLGR